MTMIQNEEVISVIKKRGAVKHFDPSYKLDRGKLEKLLATANHAPSAWNLQHWKFFVIDEWEAKEELLPIAYGQKQITEASAVIVVLGDLQADHNAEVIYELAVKNMQLPEHVKTSTLNQIYAAYAEGGEAYRRDEAIRNAALVAMQIMLAAKAQGLDSCPMGGYDSQQLITAFNIPARFIPVLLIAIGKASRPAYPSMRLPLSQKILWNQFV